MRILVTGANGMLGQDLVAEITRRGLEPLPCGHAELDITDPESVAQIPFGTFGPLDALINCAAYTAVDKAEAEEDRATEINGLGVGYLAAATSVSGARFVQISTDFVFDGQATEPYEPDDATHPLSAYGRSKLAGERATLANHANALIFRTSWLYGANGRCFPRTMINVAKAGKPLRVVADQRGNPTATPDLARVIIDALVQSIAPGIYHAAGPETMSWYDFAARTLATYGIAADLSPIPTSEYPTPATPPPYSALSFARLATQRITPMRPVNESLAEFVAQMRSSEG